MKRVLLAALLGLVAVSAETKETSSTARIQKLRQEYQQTSQKAQEAQAHMLRLEGAISILETVDAETSATDSETTVAKKRN